MVCSVYLSQREFTQVEMECFLLERQDLCSKPNSTKIFNFDQEKGLS